MISSIGGSSHAFDAAAAMRGRPPGGVKPAITIRTQEGDTVTITPKQTQNATYGRPSGTLASSGLTSNDQFEVQVTGELSDTEKADIQAVLEKMDSARSSMESGDFTAGMQAMRSAMGASGTVSSVEGPGGPPPGGPPPGLSAGDTSSALLESLEKLIEKLRPRE